MARFLPGILADGRKPRERTHVGHGQEFYRAANGTWLTGHLSAQWITAPSDTAGAGQ